MGCPVDEDGQEEDPEEVETEVTFVGVTKVIRIGNIGGSPFVPSTKALKTVKKVPGTSWFSVGVKQPKSVKIEISPKA